MTVRRVIAAGLSASMSADIRFFIWAATGPDDTRPRPCPAWVSRLLRCGPDAGQASPGADLHAGSDTLGLLPPEP